MGRRRRWAAALVAVAIGLVLAAALSWGEVVPSWRPDLRAGERYGIDVSAHQGEIDWEAVAGDDIDVAYMKATEGRDFTDRRFDANWRGARAAGLQVGAYHYFTLCSDAIEQAEHFLSVAPPDPDALPPVVDLEDLHGDCDPTEEQVRAEIERFVDRVEQDSPLPVVLYVGGDFEARYGVPPDVHERSDRWERRLFRRPVTEWVMWQFHYRAQVDGIEGGVDLDVVTDELAGLAE